MSKSAIITCTQGDFEYIDEWIEHHHKIGVDVFLIGYNGPSNKLNHFKQYDYVRYIDFSYNSTNKNIFKDAPFNGFRLQGILNILFNYLLTLYLDIDYCLTLDTDEFIHIKDENYKNINDIFDKYINKDTVCASLLMNFYTDNNLIYKNEKPVLERFTLLSDPPFVKCVWHTKMIINMKHDNVSKTKIFCGHFSNLYNELNIIPENEIALKHFFTKSLEEWISKMSTKYDSDYVKRFNGNVFNNFFYGPASNILTELKILAIPLLMEKYHVKYNINDEEESGFTKKYFELFPDLKLY